MKGKAWVQCLVTLDLSGDGDMYPLMITCHYSNESNALDALNPSHIPI